MIKTELKFNVILGELDDLVEQVGDLGGEINSIYDNCHPDFSSCCEFGNLTPEAETLLEDLELESDTIEDKIKELKVDLDLNDKQFEVMKESCFVNRWEIYAEMKCAEIVPFPISAKN